MIIPISWASEHISCHFVMSLGQLILLSALTTFILSDMMNDVICRQENSNSRTGLRE